MCSRKRASNCLNWSEPTARTQSVLSGRHWVQFRGQLSWVRVRRGSRKYVGCVCAVHVKQLTSLNLICIFGWLTKCRLHYDTLFISLCCRASACRICSSVSVFLVLTNASSIKSSARTEFDYIFNSNRTQEREQIGRERERTKWSIALVECVTCINSNANEMNWARFLCACVCVSESRNALDFN